MDDTLKSRICNAFGIPASLITKPQANVSNRVDFFRELFLYNPPPDDDNAFVVLASVPDSEWCKLTNDYSVGSENSNNLVVKDKYVSKVHCIFNCVENEWEIVDLSSKNGMYVNGAKTQRKKLCDGDIITIGKCVLVFSINT